MRTLKFRRYNPYLKEMDEPIDWLPGERTDTDFWMQFTGLFDRHGKEIYEGDIIKYWFDSPGTEKNLATVEYRGSAFWLLRNGWDISAGGLAQYNVKEVIGNVYENPEYSRNFK